MLEPGIIPEKEPLLRVGIILPEDKQQKITLAFEDTTIVSLVINNEVEVPVSDRNIEISVVDGKLRMLNIDFPESITSIKLIQEDSYSSIDAFPIIAGRGFHWAKNIHIKLPYNIELSVVDDSLLLINELPIEIYLACVATSEMGAECPESFIEAQTIVARSWMLANVEQKHINFGFDVCNDDCCQRYQGINNLTENSKEGAIRTKGQVLMFDNKICDARYSKSCGGIMEKFENLWEDTLLPYMQNRSDGKEDFMVDLAIETEMKNWVESIPEAFCSPHFIPENSLKKYLGNVDEEGQYFRWTVITTQNELADNINDKLNLDVQSIVSLKPLKRAGSGRLLELEIKYISTSGNQKITIIYKDYEIRRVLHKMFLYSSGVIIDEVFSEESDFPVEFIFRGAGWGHGAGLCQIGGLGMSLHGYKTKDILYHYYPGSELKNIYS